MEDYVYSYKVVSQDSLKELIELLTPEEIKERLLNLLTYQRLTNIEHGFLLDALKE